MGQEMGRVSGFNRLGLHGDVGLGLGGERGMERQQARRQGESEFENGVWRHWSVRSLDICPVFGKPAERFSASWTSTAALNGRTCNQRTLLHKDGRATPPPRYGRAWR